MKDKRELVERIGTRARELFESKKHNCSEAVLMAVNEVLGGGLDPETASRIASGLGGGIGHAGCVCGALSGGVLALGLFVGHDKTLLSRQKKVYRLSSALHDRFKERFRTTCCRVLTKKVKEDKKAHLAQCTRFTASTAEMAAEILLAEKPDLAKQA